MPKTTPEIIKLILNPLTKGRGNWNTDFIRKVFASLKLDTLGGAETPESVLDSWGTQFTTRMSCFMKGNAMHRVLQQWVSKFKYEDIYQRMIQSITDYQKPRGLNEEQRKELMRAFTEDKEEMPPKLANKITTKFEQNQDYEATILLLLWSIYGNEIDLLDFLYNDDEKKQEPHKEEGRIISCNKTGVIRTNGELVPGFTEDYICNRTELSKVRDSLGNNWHIRSSRCCYSKYTMWYELYDEWDNSFYGWVDESYLLWY